MASSIYARKVRIRNRLVVQPVKPWGGRVAPQHREGFYTLSASSPGMARQHSAENAENTENLSLLLPWFLWGRHGYGL